MNDASQSHRLRAHLNIHKSYQDPSQKILIALKADSYIRPHRHSLDPKEECLMAIKGLFSFIAFSDKGEIQTITLFGSEKYSETAAIASGIQVAANVWHTVIPLNGDSILFEVKDGPFNPAAAKEFGSWSPGEGCVASKAYFQKLKELSLKYVMLNFEHLKLVLNESP